jgi:hypothetical protein
MASKGKKGLKEKKLPKCVRPHFFTFERTPGHTQHAARTTVARTLHSRRTHLILCFILCLISLLFPSLKFIYLYLCLVRIILSFNLCLFVSMHFSDKNVLIIVCQSPNVDYRCNRRYIGYSSSDHYPL